MLLHSRGTSGEKTPTDINDLLEQYVNLAYHGMRAQNKDFNITIERDYDKSLEKINVVPQDISRVFLNIINNACYAAYDKKIKSSDNNFSPTLKVSTKQTNGKIEIKISDNGNGISADIMDKIFQPFFTTKPTGEGTGLGLSLSYDIVTKMHRGELKVETKEGEGTAFIIQLTV
jgi:signal transduction histidine kinase